MGTSNDWQCSNIKSGNPVMQHFIPNISSVPHFLAWIIMSD